MNVIDLHNLLCDAIAENVQVIVVSKPADITSFTIQDVFGNIIDFTCALIDGTWKIIDKASQCVIGTFVDGAWQIIDGVVIKPAEELANNVTDNINSVIDHTGDALSKSTKLVICAGVVVLVIFLVLIMRKKNDSSNTSSVANELSKS